MANITFIYDGGSSSAVRYADPSTTYTGNHYTNVVYNDNHFDYSIKEVIVNPRDGEFFENPVTRLTDVNGDPQWNIDVTNYSGDLVVTIRFQVNPTVTWNLVGCTYDAMTTYVRWYSGIGYNTNNYFGWVLANEGYDLHDANVSIIINNVDMTSALWSNPPEESVEQRLRIGIIDGNVSVSIVATSTAPIPIYLELGNCTSSNPSTSVALWGTYSTTITPDSGYTLTGATVNILINDVLHNEYYQDGVINIPYISSPVLIQVLAKPLPVLRIFDTTGTHQLLSITRESFTSLRIRIQGRTRYLEIDGIEYSYVGEAIPSGKVFAGYGRNPTQSTVIYPVDIELIINITQSTEIFEKIVDDIPVGDLILNLYRNSAEENRVDKTTYLTLIGTLTGTLRDITSITNPSILIEYEYVNFNYVYIPRFSRYYFVDEVISVKNRLWQVRLKVDVLMSYKDVIRLQQAYVSRQENEFNDYIIDNERIAQNDVDITIQTTGTTVFDSPMDISDTVINYKED